MDPTQQAASQIIKGGTVTALTVSIKFCCAMPLSALRDNPYLQKLESNIRSFLHASEFILLINRE